MKIQELINERILVLDGAMGTMIQRYNLTEADFRGERFKDVPGQMKGFRIARTVKNCEGKIKEN